MMYYYAYAAKMVLLLWKSPVESHMIADQFCCLLFSKHQIKYH